MDKNTIRAVEGIDEWRGWTNAPMYLASIADIGDGLDASLAWSMFPL